MRIAGINKNDFAAAPGVAVTLFVQGCPHRCKGCHNPETWDFEGGQPNSNDVLREIINALSADGIHRSFCVQGGEPLCPENAEGVSRYLKRIKKISPNTKIYIWTGYTMEELYKMNNYFVKECLRLADILIDGPYIEELRDITLPMRGSSNQNIINLTKV